MATVLCAGMATVLCAEMATGLCAGLATGLCTCMATVLCTGMATGLCAGMATVLCAGMATVLYAVMATGLCTGMAIVLYAGMATGPIRTGAGRILRQQKVQTAFGAHPAPSAVGASGSFPVVERLRRAVDHSPSSSAEVKNEWSCASTASYLDGLVRHNLHFNTTQCQMKIQAVDSCKITPD